MNLIFTLLITALQLKVALLGLPIQFQAERDQMLPIADQAISYAEASLATVINTPISTVEIGNAMTDPVTPQCTEIPTIVATSTRDTLLASISIHLSYSDGCSNQSTLRSSALPWSWKVVDTSGNTVDAQHGFVNHSQYDSLPQCTRNPYVKPSDCAREISIYNTPSWGYGSDDYHIEYDSFTNNLPFGVPGTLITTVGDDSITQSL